MLAATTEQIRPSFAVVPGLEGMTIELQGHLMEVHA
jgi:hypothetical protein